MESTIAIDQALRAAAEAAGWNATKIGAEVDGGEAAARKWLEGRSTPSGDKLVRLMQRLPGFAERLGFEAVARAA